MTTFESLKWDGKKGGKVSLDLKVAKDSSAVRSGLESAINKGDSVGRLIASYRASGELTAV